MTNVDIAMLMISGYFLGLLLKPVAIAIFMWSCKLFVKAIMKAVPGTIIYLEGRGKKDPGNGPDSTTLYISPESLKDILNDHENRIKKLEGVK